MNRVRSSFSALKTKESNLLLPIRCWSFFFFFIVSHTYIQVYMYIYIYIHKYVHKGSYTDAILMDRLEDSAESGTQATVGTQFDYFTKRFVRMFHHVSTPISFLLSLVFSFFSPGSSQSRRNFFRHHPHSIPFFFPLYPFFFFFFLDKMFFFLSCWSALFHH